MAHYTLIPHPEFPPLAVRAVTVELTDGGDRLDIFYRVEGAAEMVWPAPALPVRTDGLWKATCFELFLKPVDLTGYFEFNFSPSGQWAAYAFDGYRTGMRDLSQPRPPHIRRGGDRVEVDCALAGRRDAPMRVALTAVIEESGGRRSFWSLAHPPGAPDFHHDDCFVARLAAPGRP